MRKTMRWISISLVVAIMGALFLSSPPTVLAQRFRGDVVCVEPAPVYGPFFPYAYPYPYGYYPARITGTLAQYAWPERRRLRGWRVCGEDPQNQEARATTRHP